MVRRLRLGKGDEEILCALCGCLQGYRTFPGVPLEWACYRCGFEWVE